jgi:rhomboid family GlyGly-CTERM serine protease
MNTFAENSIDTKIYRLLKRLLAKLRGLGFSGDVILFILILAGLNSHLLGGSGTNLQIFLPAALRSGEWWRLFSHPFVHLTWYHLFLDAGSFFILYTGMLEKRVSRKLFYMLICGGFSLAAAWLFSPAFETRGLCGLSGIAHGLMAYSGLELMQTKKNIWIGLLSFLLVFAKSIYEFISGNVMFTFMHMGLCGTPLAACHLGGVVGGILCFFIFKMRSKSISSSANPSS